MTMYVMVAVAVAMLVLVVAVLVLRDQLRFWFRHRWWPDEYDLRELRRRHGERDRGVAAPAPPPLPAQEGEAPSFGGHTSRAADAVPGELAGQPERPEPERPEPERPEPARPEPERPEQLTPGRVVDEPALRGHLVVAPRTAVVRWEPSRLTAGAAGTVAGAGAVILWTMWRARRSHSRRRGRGR
jgi:hypothetical protein